ncbi:DNA-directed RNA polymerase subunit N [Candidatus Micrarchaeota archaeon]|nr:DNA-directed RNA polymerase subunit N [Candidatus Micrarchaeota archaeon]
MMPPIRCFTCGKVIGDKFEEYSEKTGKGEDAGKVLDAVGVSKYCCRRMFVGHVDVVDETIRYGRF